MSITTTTTQTTTVTLKPAVKAKVVKALREYATWHAKEKQAKAEKAKLNATIEELIIDADEFAALQDGMNIEGFPLKHVSPTRDTTDWKKFVELGGSLQTVKNATFAVPTKSYLKITCPGEKED